MKRLRLVYLLAIVVALSLSLVTSVNALAPPQSCEQTLGQVGALADLAVDGRSLSERNAARVIADLREQLVAEKAAHARTRERLVECQKKAKADEKKPEEKTP